MGKGRLGMSGSDRGLSQIEKDIREAKRNGEYDERGTAPVTMAEILKNNEFLETFPGKYPNYGRWELALKDELTRIKLSYSLLADYGIYPRTFRVDAYEQKIEPREFAHRLKDKTGL